ncbi:hypothetical protein GXB85_13835 [Cellulomonas sp. APG4]|uniref:hypothetical protein n=1 Tax=Cellulomonas sp. APG4 TaxID=1538656 RepID=UPI00137AB192|nr:hypothetical protein [Cellulomonas sp. APG4]NCT92023.1 hypothetical protein [Cellulomonas sp. APG4]
MSRLLRGVALPVAGLLVVLAGATWAVHAELVEYARFAATIDVDLPAPDVGSSLAAAARWSAQGVAPGLLLLWIATRGAVRPLVPALLGCGGALLWAVLGQLPDGDPVLPWLGPVQPYDWVAESAHVGLVHPARAVPLLVVIATALTVWGASGLREDDAAAGRGVARTRDGAVALATLMGLALVCVALATGAAVAATSWPGATWWDLARAPEVTETTLRALALVVVAALASGRLWAVVPLVLAWVAAVSEDLVTWFGGAGDVLLLPPLLSATGALLAWLWRPCARGFETLVSPTTPGAVSDPAPLGAPQPPKGPTLTTERG